MLGPYPLNIVNIANNVPDQTGVLLLIQGDTYEPIFVESSEHLKEALTAHLPENEKSTEIKKRLPDKFLFQMTKNDRLAFDLECRWYHLFKPLCNLKHPAYRVADVSCPVCGFAGK